MIVLDEHLKGLGVADGIRRWYRGRVSIITDLRPGSVIKDEAIPVLLRSVAAPTFVTLNSVHFWQRVQPEKAFCIVCLDIPTDRVNEVPILLRRLFRSAQFRTRGLRAGRAARVSGEQITHYAVRRAGLITTPLPPL